MTATDQLTEYAVLKVRKSDLPPNASLVLAYEHNGEVIIDEDQCPGWAAVRREHANVVLKWIDIIASQAAIHFPTEPVPELVQATTAIKAALGEKP